jgi:hypothetical protein
MNLPGGVRGKSDIPCTSHRQRSPQALAFSNFRASFAHALSCRVGSVIRARFKEESFLKRTQQDVGTIVRKKRTRGPDVWVWRFYETGFVKPQIALQLTGIRSTSQPPTSGPLGVCSEPSLQSCPSLVLDYGIYRIPLTSGALILQPSELSESGHSF